MHTGRATTQLFIGTYIFAQMLVGRSGMQHANVICMCAVTQSVACSLLAFPSCHLQRSTFLYADNSCSKRQSKVLERLQVCRTTSGDLSRWWLSSTCLTSVSALFTGTPIQCQCFCLDGLSVRIRPVWKSTSVSAKNPLFDDLRPFSGRKSGCAAFFGSCERSTIGVGAHSTFPNTKSTTLVNIHPHTSPFRQAPSQVAPGPFRHTIIAGPPMELRHAADDPPRWSPRRRR